MHKKLIKKYTLGSTIDNNALKALDNQVLNSSISSSQPFTLPAEATQLNLPLTPQQEVLQMVLTKFDNMTDEQWNKFMLPKSVDYSSMIRSLGIGMGTSYLGGMLGNLIGGELGNGVGAVAGNLGNNILNYGVSGGLKNFSKFSNWGNLAGGIASGILDRSTTHQRTSGKYGSLAAGVDMASPLVNLIWGTNNPYGMVGTLGMSAVNKITGGTDGMTIADSLLGSSSLAGALTAVNPVAGAAYIAVSGINSATGKTTDKILNNDFMSQEELDPLWASYNKSQSDHLNAMQYGNKKYGGISVLTGSFGRANDKVGKDNRRTDNLLKISRNRQLGNIRGTLMADINSLDYRLNTFGGYNQYGTYIGRKGMKLPTKQEINRIKEILNSRKNIELFKKGGQMNVIPEGALHARLHHMETGDKITRKGIPVIDKSGEQQAEIERNEIIFSFDVTTKLEALRKDGSEKAAIAAGKLLVDEIFHNTDDRTGLIAEVIGLDEAKKPVFKEGGVIKAEEPIIEKFQEGGILEEGENAIIAEEPQIGIDDEDVEQFLSGGIIAEKPINIKEKIETFKKGGKLLIIPDFLNYNEELDEYTPNLQFTFNPKWYDSKEAKEFRKKYVKDEWKDDSGYHIKYVNKKNWRPRGVPSFNNARPYAIPESGYPEGWVYLPADGIMGRPEGEPGRYIGEDGGVYWYKDGGTVNNKKEKKTPEEILKILSNDPNFDDGFIDEPEQDDDLSFNSLPQTIKLKITEEEWKDFLFSVFSQNEMVMKKLNSMYHD